jgi:hypothetical protein
MTTNNKHKYMILEKDYVELLIRLYQTSGT